MILYCEKIIGNELTSCEKEEAQYQIIYTNLGANKETFSMNYLNTLTNEYVNVKENSDLYKKGLKFARILFLEITENINCQKRFLIETTLN